LSITICRSSPSLDHKSSIHIYTTITILTNHLCLGTALVVKSDRCNDGWYMKR
jgi:hypothetical protein